MTVSQTAMRPGQQMRSPLVPKKKKENKMLTLRVQKGDKKQWVILQWLFQLLSL